MLWSKTQPRVAPLPRRPFNPRQPSRAHNLCGKRRTWSVWEKRIKSEHVRAGVRPPYFAHSPRRGRGRRRRRRRRKQRRREAVEFVTRRIH